MTRLQLAVLGATGRMGGAILAAIAESSDCALSGALVRPGHPAVGRAAGVPTDDAGGPRFTDDIEVALAGADVAVDFTLPAAALVTVGGCERAGCPLVIGTTGLDAAVTAALQRLARRQPVVQSANTSVGVTLAVHLAGIAAAILDSSYDAEIVEAHHRGKVDSPSGTALALGRRVAAARGGELDRLADYRGPAAPGPRQTGAIGFASIRGGDIVGDHRLLFAGDGEVFEIAHRATSRTVFAAGALRAARWIAGKQPGLYGMNDVLGLPAR